MKQSRIVKRRSLAKELCDEGVVLLNGRASRAGHEVSPGDTLVLNLRSRKLTVLVKEIPLRPPPGDRANGLYETISDEKIEDVTP